MLLPGFGVWIMSPPDSSMIVVAWSVAARSSAGSVTSSLARARFDTDFPSRREA